jgi:hypothetical protein
MKKPPVFAYVIGVTSPHSIALKNPLGQRLVGRLAGGGCLTRLSS